MEYQNYMTDSMANDLQEYLTQRTSLNILQEQRIQDREKWLKTLVDDVEVQHIGDSSGVIDTANMLENGYKAILDEDTLHGLSEEDKSAVRKLTSDFAEKYEGSKLNQEITELENLLIPSSSIIEIFKKINEDMSNVSGVKPVSEDVSYLRGLLVKHAADLSKEYVLQAEKYPDEIDNKITKINQLLNKLKQDAEDLKSSLLKTLTGEFLIKNRLEDSQKIFNINQAKTEILTSKVTGDLQQIIPEIRQCLACTSRECNNDTNLTFGDTNRFLILARRNNQENSISDQLVTLLKTRDGSGQE